MRAFSSCREQGYSLLWCMSFSLQWLLWLHNIADFKLKIDLIPTQTFMFVPVRQLSVADRFLKLFSELN